jgi:tRNA (cmo5U34)-methyltransferase
MKNRMKCIKQHFEDEANVFDKRVVNIVPHYVEMLDALVTAIPFSRNVKIRVADLGVVPVQSHTLLREDSQTPI